MSAELSEVIINVLRGSLRHPLPFDKIRQEVARVLEYHREDGVRALLDDLENQGVVIVLGGARQPEYFLAENLQHLKSRLCELLEAHHTRAPYEPGAQAGELRKRFSRSKSLSARKNVDARLFALALTSCQEDGSVIEVEGGVRLSSFVPEAGEVERLRETKSAILAYLTENALSRVPNENLAGQLGVDAKESKALVTGLLQAGKLLRVHEDIYSDPATIDGIKEVLEAAFRRQRQLDISELKETLQLPRRVLIPVVEYLDRIQYTRRSGKWRERVGGASLDRPDPSG